MPVTLTLTNDEVLTAINALVDAMQYAREQRAEYEQRQADDERYDVDGDHWSSDIDRWETTADAYDRLAHQVETQARRMGWTGE